VDGGCLQRAATPEWEEKAKMNRFLAASVRLAVFSSVLLGGAARAADQTWVGGGANTRWSTGVNWSGGTSPAGGDRLLFSGGSGWANTNDLAALTNGGLVFSGGGFQLWGNPLVFAANTTHSNVTGDNVIHLGLYSTQKVATTWYVAANSSLTLAGNVQNAHNDGTNNPFFYKYDPGTLSLTGSNYWTGGAYIKNGAVVVDGGSLALNGVGSSLTLRISAGAAGQTARLVLTNGATCSTINNLMIGRLGASGGTNILDIHSGTLVFPGPANDASLIVGYDTNHEAIVNHHGGWVDIQSVPGSGGSGVLNFCYGPNVNGTYHLNGGVLRANQIKRGNTNHTTATLNLNGGTLQPTADQTDFIQNLSAVNVRDGGVTFDTGGFALTVAQPLLAAGTGGLTKLGSGSLSLAAINTYTGPTTVSNGTLLVNGRIGTGQVTIASGTLGGMGTILGPVSVSSAGTLSPGNNWIGTLTISNRLVLAGTTLMQLYRTGATNDRIAGLTHVTYGGTLTVTCLAGTLMSGDTFQLFDAGSYTNAFAVVNLPVLAAGLAWTNRLAVDGTIAVTGSAPPPIVRPPYLPRQKYNVLFIASDDFKPLCGFFGDTGAHPPTLPAAITPNLDTLASGGVVFTRANCQMALCSPSRTSLMTGLRPDTTKVWNLTTHFRNTIPNTITLAQHFAANGFSTRGIGKIYHGGYDDAASWSDGSEWPSSANTYYESPSAAMEDAGNHKADATDCGEFQRDGSPVTDYSYADGVSASNALARLSLYSAAYRSNGTPFFLAVGFYKPHLPFNSPKKYWDLYNPDDIDMSAYDGLKHLPIGTLPFTAPGSTEPCGYTNIGGVPSPTNEVPTQAQARRLLHGYLACLSYVDAQVGKLLDALETNGLATNTIVVFWGDHGWHLADHGAFWAKHSVYEQAARAPLIFRVPGMDRVGSAGRKCSAPVEFVDVYPTLVDLAGLPTPNQPAGLELQGLSLAPLLEDPAQPWQKGAISQYPRTISGAGVTHPGIGMGYSLRTSRHRYTEWWRTASSNTVGGNIIDRDVKLYSSPEHLELYDMAHDSSETLNLAYEATNAALVTNLAALLDGGNGWCAEGFRPPPTYPTNYAAWQDGYLQPGITSAEMLAVVDPDDDGLPNLLEYAFGSHPLEPDPQPVSHHSENVGGTDYYQLDYPKASGRSDVLLAVEQSTNLITWQTNGVVTETSPGIGPLTNCYSRVAVPTNLPAGVFLRLKVSR
jgi:iduronate 2-sulfatase